jgi:predicted PurR-regulated permease PerM
MKKLLTKYQNYLGIFGAILVFGSWILTSVIADTVKNYQSNLEFITNNDEIQETLNDFKRQISNLDKTILRTRGVDTSGDVRQFTVGQKRFYEWSKEYEIINSFFEDWNRLKSNADKTNAKIKIVDVPFWISRNFDSTYIQINELYGTFKKTKDKVDALLHENVGQSKAIKDIANELADTIADSVKNLRDIVKDSKINSDYIILVNKLYKSNYEIKNSIENNLAFYKALYSIFKYVSILFYLIGTALTIYSKFFEVKARQENPI